MKNHNAYVLIGLVMLFAFFPNSRDSINTETQRESIMNDHPNNENMKLGAFSVSLNVKDINVSKAFYECLGFSVLGGDIKMNYLIMKNENSLIGLFQGMFEENILTFNPGWDENAKEVEPFDDVREIQRRLKDKGIQLDTEIKANTSGPASIILKDPDGNTIFIDQHR